MNENEIATIVIGAAIEIHKRFGPGLLESVYERALAYDLAELGLDVKVQVSIPLEYKELVIETAFRADMLVNDLVMIELKSVEELDSVYFKRTLTYLRLTGLKLALLINFNVELLKNGVHRIANNL